jgi:prepilin-type N-terminal cleavage/methylation domain-containing protein
MKNKIFLNSIGFTLIEIMVVVAIIVIMAAIAIPGMIRGKIVANESVAVTSCRAIINACLLYANNNELFPDALTNMATPLSDPPYIDETLAQATEPSKAKNGYWFEYSPSVGKDSFEAYGRPKNNLTGRRRFFFTEDGIIHYSDNGDDATGSDPIIN